MVTMPPKGRPGRPRSEESREAILKAATELMLEVGPRRMTVDQIALRSGVSRATIYKWWPNKSAVAIEAFLDQMMVDFHEYVMAGFRDEDGFRRAFGDDARRSFKELWDYSREMTARLTWKPYMFSRRLAPLLREVQTPTLILHGAEDAIVPVDVAKQYAQALPNARLELVSGAGHLVEYEDPGAIAARIATFALET